MPRPKDCGVSSNVEVLKTSDPEPDDSAQPLLRYSSAKPRRGFQDAQKPQTETIVAQKRSLNLLLGRNETTNSKVAKEATTEETKAFSPAEDIGALEHKCWAPMTGREPFYTLQLGQRVCVNQAKVGVLRYLGPMLGERGVWCGIELDEPHGLNSGSVKGVRYFTCLPQHGVFAPIEKVTSVRTARRSLRRDPAPQETNSGPFSLLAGLRPSSLLESDEDNAVQTPGSTTAVPEWGLSKQSSFEMDESLGLLTPEQMDLDFTGCSGSPGSLFAKLDNQRAAEEAALKHGRARTDGGVSCPTVLSDTRWKDKYLPLTSDACLLDQMSFAALDSLVEDSYDLKSPDLQDVPANTGYSPRLDLSEGTLSPEDLPVDTPVQEDARPLSDSDHKTDDVKVASDSSWNDKYLPLAGETPLPEAPLLDSLVEDRYESKSPEHQDTPAAKPDSEPGCNPLSPRLDLSERTLSPEDLPVDTPLQDDVRPLTDVDHKTDEVKGSSPAGTSSRSSAAPVPPSSFVTSVTSITSLDNGYQGDGEWSRPASRGADQSPTGMAPHVKPPAPPAPIPVDPLTDSDFFTESEADPHEELRGGDRRAQVIDGTLYGGTLPAHQQQRCPSFTASNEEMVSSGVFSDLERRTEEATSSDGGKNGREEEAGDFSPTGSTKTISSKSEQSQVKEVELPSNKNNNNEEEYNLKNQLPPPDDCTAPGSNDSPKIIPDGKPIKSAAPPPSGKKEEAPQQLKKYKMPRRNVVSKIKAMIESSTPATPKSGGGNASTEDENQENWRPTRPPKPARKTGKWDAVMNKIAQGQAEQKLKPSRLKEVKSKVYSNISPAPAQMMPGRSSSTVSNSAVSNKSKSRRARTRTSSSSLQQQQQQKQQQQQQQQTGNPGSPNSTPRSSMSDLSTSAPQSTNRSSKKQQRSASPLSDGSTNSATSHVMARPANNHLPRQSAQKNGVSPAADMKTPTTRKQPSRRSVASTGQKPTPLRDHNRLAGGGGGVVKSEPLAKLQSAPAPRAPPPVATPKTEVLLPQLRHAAAGFEALSVLVNYLVNDLDAFSTQRLKEECNNMKAEWLRTKLDLEELQASYGRMQDMIVDERTNHRKELDDLTECQQQALQAAEAKSNQERSQLVDRYEKRLADFDERFQKEREETEDRHASEQSALEKAHAERVAELLRDIEQIREDHKCALTRLQDDHKHVEEDMRAKMSVLETDNLAMKEQACKLMDSMKKDKDTKLQATAARCRELQDEVHSLQTVLELKNSELQDLRRQNAKLAREADQLPGALQRIAALEARVEDLQEQLTVKASYERQLSEEHRRTVESLQQEAKQRNRLSLHNEELQWKLKQNTEVVNVLAALNSAAVGSPLQLPSSPDPARRTTPGSTRSLTDLYSSPRQGCRASDPAGQLFQGETDNPSSHPASPKVKSVVEKSDSVAWVLDMEETPDVLVSRLMRRAGSLRMSPSHSQSPSLGNSRSLPPPKRQRCKMSLSPSPSATSVSQEIPSMKTNGSGHVSSIRSRLRFLSTSMIDDYVDCLDPMTSSPMHHSLQLQRCTNGPSDKACEVDVVLHDDELLEETLGDLRKQTASPSECSNDDSPTKSSSSSASSSASSSPSSDSSIRSGGGAGGGSSGREYRHHKKSSSKLLSDPRRALDLGEADVLPLPALLSSNDANSDLSLLAACAAAQPPLMLKESAGEAMISEETSEDENEHDVVSSSDERSCSQDEDDDSSSSESSSGLRL